MDADEFQKLQDRVAELKSERDRLIGSREPLMLQLKQKFSCKTLKAARALQTQLRETHRQLEKKRDAALAAFKKELDRIQDD